MDIVTNIQQLRKPCFEVKDFSKMPALADTMFAEMRLHNGQGLAANQIGIQQQVIVMNRERATPICLINPVFLKEKGVKDGIEGCLSIPGKRYSIRRAETVTVRYFNQYGVVITSKFYGAEARRLGHESDHLYGILISDIGTEIVPE
jgi:peptide deformylase